MNKKYFQVNFDGSCREISRRDYLKKFESVEAGENDIILWYEDRKSVFIGDCSVNPRDVVYSVVKIRGYWDNDYYMAGDEP